MAVTRRIVVGSGRAQVELTGDGLDLAKKALRALGPVADRMEAEALMHMRAAAEKWPRGGILSRAKKGSVRSATLFAIQWRARSGAGLEVSVVNEARYSRYIRSRLVGVRVDKQMAIRDGVDKVAANFAGSMLKKKGWADNVAEAVHKVMSRPTAKYDADYALASLAMPQGTQRQKEAIAAIIGRARYLAKRRLMFRLPHKQHAQRTLLTRPAKKREKVLAEEIAALLEEAQK